MTTLLAAPACGCDTLATTDVDDDDTPSVDTPIPAPTRARWQGVLGIEGQATGDGRYIEHDALRWDISEDNPAPIRYVASDVGAHDGAQVVGTIDVVERRDNGVIWGAGDFDLGSDIGTEAMRQVAENLTTGVSMDLDDVTFEVRVAAEMITDADDPDDDAVVLLAETPDADGRIKIAQISPDDELRVTTSGRIRAATIVAVPAFSDARIALAPTEAITAAGGNPNQARAPRGTPIGGQWIPSPGLTLSQAQSYDSAGGSSGSADTQQLRDRLSNPLTPGQGLDLTQHPSSAGDHLVRHPDGSITFSPERVEHHVSEIEQALSTGTVAAPGEATFNMLGGGPASGKSSTILPNHPDIGRDGGAAVINSDEFKSGTDEVDMAGLPEYSQMLADGQERQAAGFVHEESSYMAKEAMAEAFERNLNTTLDGTGDGSLGSVTSKIQAARDAGYGSVNAYYATCDIEEAVARATARAERSGRYVNLDIVRSGHQKVAAIFPQVMNLFDEVELWETTVTPPVLIGSKEPGGEFVVTDQALWDAFLARSNG